MAKEKDLNNWKVEKQTIKAFSKTFFNLYIKLKKI